tara:strand:+ start:182 stop:412 length:231 start_codon:yes stop_codon:yes gene_type:complete
MKKINDDKCICCGKQVKMMKAPYDSNYKGGVDVLLYAHYGSKHSEHEFPKETSGNIGITPKWCVICDECYEKNISN